MSKKIFSVLALAVFLLAGCHESKRKAPSEELILRPASMDYTHQDSVQIRQLVDTYISCLTSHDIESVCDMLYFVRNDSLLPLTDHRRKGLSQMLAQLPIYDCEMKSMILRSDKNNAVQLSLRITEEEDEQKGAGFMNMSINPVYKEGNWYLTILDKDAEGVYEIYK